MRQPFNSAYKRILLAVAVIGVLALATFGIKNLVERNDSTPSSESKSDLNQSIDDAITSAANAPLTPQDEVFIEDMTAAIGLNVVDFYSAKLLVLQAKSNCIAIENGDDAFKTAMESERALRESFKPPLTAAQNQDFFQIGVATYCPQPEN